MMRPTVPTTGPAPVCSFAGLALTLALALAPALNLNAGTSATAATIRYTGHDFEGRQALQLEWPAVANATYLVQSATDLAPADAWQTMDVVTPTNGAGQYEIKGRSIPENSAEYFRLVLPQPQIFSVEPAIIAPGLPVDLYVLGQCFDTNDVLLINGMPQTNVVYLDSQLVKPVFTPGSPGTYTVQLAVGGQVISSFNVTCADPLANPELVFQGPPTEPPASPAKKDFKGHVTLMKAFDDGDGDVQEGKKDFKGHVTLLKAFDDDGGDSVRHTKTGHVTLMKAFDDGSDDIQEGKKGLNAVNVKLARMAGGGGGGGGGSAVIMPFSGEVQECDADLVIPGRGLDFIWARTYHSRVGRSGGSANGWTFSYDLKLQPLGGDIVIHDGTGRADRFVLQTNGTYTCPEFFREGTLSNGVFRLTFADTGYWEFNPFDGTASAGLLAHIMNGNGDVMTLNYDSKGRLAQVVDDLGRTNTVGYNLAGQLISVTDFSGRTVTYAYYQPGEIGGSSGDLKSVTSPPVTGTPNGNDFPDGKTVTYTYSTGYTNEAENHLLLTITDAKGQPACQFTYEHNAADPNYLHCIASKEGTGKTERITVLPQIAAPANRFAVVRCIVNDPVGNVTECFYDSRNRCVMERDYTGRATPETPVTDTLNRPTGKLRSSDPDYYETQWSWNSDSLCTRLVVDSHEIQCLYESDFNPATQARKRADLRVVRELAAGGVDMDGDGVADVSDRTWRYEYDPRFGSDPTASLGKKLYVGNLPFAANDPAAGDGIISNTRQRVLDIENVLKNLGLLSRTSGGKRFGIGDTSPENPSGRKGWDGTIKGLIGPEEGVAFSSVMARAPAGVTHEYHRFVTTATDPRGNVATSAYDANGNRVKVKFYWDRQSSAERDFAYDTHGQLTVITNLPDANGRQRVDFIQWSQDQVVQCVVDADGLALTTAFEYDNRGNVTRVIDPRTNDWLYTYNSLDQCVRAQTPTNLTSRCATDFFYDANDNLVQCATELRDETDTKLADITSTFDYDPMNRLIRVAEPISVTSSAITEFAYDDNHQLTEIRSPLAVLGLDAHQIQAFTYDERGLLFQFTSAPGTGLSGTNEFSYTATGQTATKKYVDDQDTLKADFAYDGFDRLMSVTDPMGNVVTCTYDGNDNPVYARVDAETVDVPSGGGNVRYSECRWKYDSLDRCVQSSKAFFDPATQSPIGSGVAMSSFTYAPIGDCASETDSLGRTTTYAYDTAGRPASATSPGGKTIVVTVRDAFGNTTRSTQTDTPDLGGPPQVFYTTFTYDRLNRCVSSSDNVGNTASCAYDSLNRIVRITDSTGNDTTYAYDELGNCLASTAYLGSASALPATSIRTNQAAYDVSSRCLTAIDANGNPTTFTYDSLNRPTIATHADGTVEKLIWSPRSNLLSVEDANSTTVTNIYDYCNRVIHRDIAARGPAAATTTFETFAYDGCSRLVSASNDVSHLDFSYDSLGNCTASSQDGLAQSATYDSEGNLLSLTYPGGRVVTYGYDALDQVNNIATTSGGVTHSHLAQFAYAGPGRLASIERDNGINARIDWDGLVSPPNAGGDYGWQQVGRIRDGSAASPSLAVDRTGSYNRTQSKTALADAVSFHNLALTYDALDQLVDSSVSVGSVPLLETVYGLDDNGNRQQVITNGIPMPDYTMAGTLPPGDFQMNRYTDTPFGAQQYDANGNLMVRISAAGPTFYRYDYADRLVEVDALGGEGFIAPVAAFTYDALGHRISKTTYPPSPLMPVTTQYVHGGCVPCDLDGDMIVETRQSGSLIDSYIHKLDDGIMARCDAAGQPQYFHGDDLGNTLALTDTGGNVLERYAYDDYGQPQFLAADGTPLVDSSDHPLTASSLGNPFLFHGLEWDSETGLLCADGSDYLDPLTGRAIRGKVKVIKDMGGSGFAIEPRNILKTFFETGDIPTQDQRTVSRNVLKSFFSAGDKPTQAQFSALIDSMVNRLDDRNLLGLRVSGLAGNNPWSEGSPSAMKKGTVKFFNDAKGFGMVVGDSAKTHTKTGHVTLMK